MASIKQQKLELYIKLLKRRDMEHVIIRGLKGSALEIELERINKEYYSTVTEVPKDYTLARLKFLTE